ncbi:MAG: AAA family ATPase [Rhizobiales bacterium]|nr:division plane positioning ATPase MipZ [Hyphomicrobiales bacterium]NRB15753.1 AAA family ATPase [Hyphomicrobiales bacterium]
MTVMTGNAAENNSSRVIVLGNEKGGTGKTTLAIHLLLGLQANGARVAAIDLDGRVGGFSRFLKNREAWAKNSRQNIYTPPFFTVSASQDNDINKREQEEFAGFAGAVEKLEHISDYLILDLPSGDTYLGRLAHSMADILITPINDGFLDVNVLGDVDNVDYSVNGINPYGQYVMDCLARRKNIDGSGFDWLLVKNRVSSLGAKHKQKVDKALTNLADKLGATIASNIGDRVIFRELYAMGLSVFDVLDRQTGVKATASHNEAKREILDLIEFINR